LTRIYKILAATEWDAAVASGRFDGSAVDHKDGYIHLSTAAQAGDTARLHFAGQTGLVLLELVAEDFGADLKWEPSRGGALFPHLYAPLDPTRVRSVRALELNAEGWPDPGPLAP
jgi:uncharacterized protein (DUF952 family)